MIERFKNEINIVGWRNGYFKDEEFNEIINDINNKVPDVLYIALGTPQKEYLLYDLRNSLKCKFAVGVGGAFNIIAGCSWGEISEISILAPRMLLKFWIGVCVEASNIEILMYVSVGSVLLIINSS